jgi:hypothetical protein
MIDCISQFRTDNVVSAPYLLRARVGDVHSGKMKEIFASI